MVIVKENNKMIDYDISFCGNANDCPSKDFCRRAISKPGIHTYCNFYKENEECEFFLRNNVYIEEENNENKI